MPHPYRGSGERALARRKSCALARLEAAGQSLLFFVNAETGRGNLIYCRYDGNYGLITPAS